MKVGVISDTHDQYENILKAVEILNKENVEVVIHCDDWVSPFTLAFYKDLKAPIKGVFGNNDADRFRHLRRAESQKLNITFEERFLDLNLDGKRIAVFHGDYRELTDALLTCGKYDAVFHGHFHIAENTLVGKTLSLNPGTLMNYTDEEVQGASIAIYETTTNSAKILTL